MIRLDKFIAQATPFSRREIHSLIKQGAVSVSGKTATQAAVHLQGDEDVRVQGEQVISPNPRYLMLHKPQGYVCANHDSEHPTVLDLLDLPKKTKLQIVGRLDVDTTGLVLLTDDGQWNHRVTAPRNHYLKTYEVKTVDPIPADAIDKFLTGLMLHGETKPTKPAQLRLTASHSAEIKLAEGKYHQVKRMFAALGNRVIALHRTSIGHIHLDSQLAPGEYRSLTLAEIRSLDDE